MSNNYFTEWDLFYIPKTDYSPKWINYKYKNKKFYNNACMNAKALSTGKETCSFSSVRKGPWYDRCKYCPGGGWALLGNGCWRVSSYCPTSYYNYNSLCYGEDSACKPEMITNKNDYHCSTDWNVRDAAMYELVNKDPCCQVQCIYGVKKVSTYDPAIFAPLGNIVKSIKMVCESNNIYCDELIKTFRVTIQLANITSWDVLEKIKTIFETQSMNANDKPTEYSNYDNIAYLNFIGIEIIRFYMMMNVKDTSAGMVNAGLNKFYTHVPVFIVFNNETDKGIISYDDKNTSRRDYALSFYGSTIWGYANCSDTSRCYYKTFGIDKSQLTLKNINPQSSLSFKKIGDTGVFLVKPTQFCDAAYSTNKDHYNKGMIRYNKIDPIIYLVYYSINDLKDLGRGSDIISAFKEKYIDNPNLMLSPQCKAWNKYVYYNHILPNICYQVETNSSYCNNIMNYDGSPPTMINQNCSVATSNRFPDCKTYLMTNIELEQPNTNNTRTFDKLDEKQLAFCNQNNTLECQCYNREKHSRYTSFLSSYNFPVDSKGNAGCWYKPCMDDPQSNIFIPSNFRFQNLNCADRVCQNIITVINRPENTANISNLNLSTSCYDISTLKPKNLLFTSIPQTIPVQTTAPTPAEEPEEIIEEVQETTVNLQVVYIAWILFGIFVILSIVSMYYWFFSTDNSIISVFFKYVAPILAISCFFMIIFIFFS